MSSNNMQEIIYGKRLFAFIDFLGFEDWVNESKDNPSVVREIYNSLEIAPKIAHILSQSKLDILKVDLKQYVSHIFSDTVTISCPYKALDDFVAMAAFLTDYQHKMWCYKGIFLRGAITYADIYDKEAIVFGPAIIEAYHLEKDKDKAVWPRILVSQSVLDALSHYLSDWDSLYMDFLRKGENGLVFLDYLRVLFHRLALSEFHRESRGNPLELFQAHKTRIEEKMTSIKKDNILGKYMSLAKYHNSVIDEHCKTIGKLVEDKDNMVSVLSDMLPPVVPAYIGTLPNPELTGIALMWHVATRGTKIDTLRDESWKYLNQLDKALWEFKIDIESLT